MNKWRFQITINEWHILFSFIFMVHASFLLFQSKNGHYSLSIEGVKSYQRPKEIVEPQFKEALKAKWIYRPVAVSPFGRKVLPEEELKKLLRQKIVKNEASVSKGSLISESRAIQEINQKDVLDQDFNLSDIQKKNLIRRIIKENMKGISICNQKHMLKDEFLLGSLKINMKIQGAKNVALSKFKGHGREDIIQSLESCVKEELVAMQFPVELTNQEIAFEVKVN